MPQNNNTFVICTHTRVHTSQIGRLHWEDPAQHLHGFAFLFFLFKLFYLACLYKNFRTEAGLYSQPPPPDISERNSLCTYTFALCTLISVYAVYAVESLHN